MEQGGGWAAGESESRPPRLRPEVVIVRRRQQLADAARGADPARVVDGFTVAERAQYRETMVEALLQPRLQTVVVGIARSVHQLEVAIENREGTPCINIAGAGRRRVVD